MDDLHKNDKDYLSWLINEKISKQGSSIILGFMIIFIFGLFIFILVLGETGRLDKSNDYIEKIDKWQNEFRNHGINSIYFVLERKEFRTGDHGSVWLELKKLYVNGYLVDPDSLYRRKELLYKHCGKYYFYGYTHSDSVSYIFSSIKKFTMYSYQLKSISNTICVPRNKKFLTYKHKLPKCWDY